MGAGAFVFIADSCSQRIILLIILISSLTISRLRIDRVLILVRFTLQFFALVLLLVLLHNLPTVFRTLPRFRQVSIMSIHYWSFVSMPDLPEQGSIRTLLRAILLHCAL